MKLAPIALFTYNRPSHTRKTIEALKTNPLARESEIFIFSDGVKNNATREGVAATRKYLEGVSGFAKVTTIFRDENLGLADSITTGVTDLVGRFDKIIVLEDDLVTSPHFLKYMNDALSFYASKEMVACIHGYVYPIENKLPETFFLRGADCWGWATWKRGWSIFDPDGQSLLLQLRSRGLIRSFDPHGALGYTRMLERQIAGKNNSWAIRWHASAFLAGKLTLYPGRSLVKNIGLDNTGTHCSNTDYFNVRLSEKPIQIGTAPMREDSAVAAMIENYYVSIQSSRWRDKIWAFFKSMVAFRQSGS